MPRGGRRVGAGRKPGPRRVVLGMPPQRVRGMELPPAVPAEVCDGLLIPPDDLSVEAQACWTAFAGQALAERTLTPATAAGFRQCCQQWAYVAALEARIALLGAATHDAAPYLGQYVRLSQRLDASLGRFRLTAFGKPATSDKPKAAANPWGAISGAGK